MCPPSAKAGLMIRESLDPASRMAWVRVTPAAVPTLSGGIGSNDVRFAYRTGVREVDRDGSVHNGGRNEEGSGTPGYPNAWLRLRRTGAVLIAYHGSNGVDWIEQGRQDTARWAGGALPPNAFLGLAVTSHNDGILCTGNFSNVTATP